MTQDPIVAFANVADRTQDPLVALANVLQAIANLKEASKMQPAGWYREGD